MGIVAFEWQTEQLTLFQKREIQDKWVIEATKWHDNETILRGDPRNNTGTWIGVSKKGRVAFQVDQLYSNLQEFDLSNPVDFLEGKMSPLDYAKQLCVDTEYGVRINKGLAYDMIVADIDKSLMYHIFKTDPKETHAYMEKIGFGFHSLSSDFGLNSKDAKDQSKLQLLDEWSRDDNITIEIARLGTMALTFCQEPFGNSEVHGPKCMTALVVKPSKEAVFYENCMRDGEWEETVKEFNIE